MVIKLVGGLEHVLFSPIVEMMIQSDELHHFSHQLVKAYQNIWVNYNDLTATSLESWLVRGIIPKWPYFRLVKYSNLPRKHPKIHRFLSRDFLRHRGITGARSLQEGSHWGSAVNGVNAHPGHDLLHLNLIFHVYHDWLVVWNMAFMTFHILGIISPIDELIFFRGVGIPPTRWNGYGVRV